ncbi:hypothetical protein DV451_001833 [Geotrichum candidum]|uniref:Cytochrome b-c1 complex subunit Rieske, mitochondrial n=1 Tax=Geotrichum candidum TaxID=1173061 RepID=A0A9P5G631_GEOCN|nr:hypothetical protein DV451_001833 [Geotrichum candidum]KAF5108938.1 hypothetical protein DV453_001879 [Geotrichum candidum]KAF5117041.1 hypothetical protein DV454_001360 [Geotrichum candidum]
MAKGIVKKHELSKGQRTMGEFSKTSTAKAKERQAQDSAASETTKEDEIDADEDVQKRLNHSNPIGGSTYKIPDFSPYLKSDRNTDGNRAAAYFVVGTLGMVSAAAAKATVQDFLSSMSASADVLALAKVEVNLAAVPEGKNIIVKWRGKPVFIRHRTAHEIAEARAVPISALRDPETDEQRVKDPAWLIMLGICTHLGCVPIGEAGDYNGWFCPCHGSHYDISGRIRKGPAPLNLEIPEYELNDGELVIG